MTKAEMKFLLKRYRYLQKAICTKKNSAFFTVSRRHERIPIDAEIIKFSNAVQKALEKADDLEKQFMELLVLEGKSDVYIFTHCYVTRSSYYSFKETFLDRLFCLCIFAGLVSEDEI